MAIPKITGSPFSNISTWLWERKIIKRPNPLKPSYTEVITDKEMDNNKIQQTLIGFYNKINKIIDEVNDLGRRVTKNENDITIINKTLKMKSTASHSHMASSIGAPTGPPMGRKGGSVKKMQPGGRARPVPTSKEDWKQKLIDEIKQLQNQNSG